MITLSDAIVTDRVSFLWFYGLFIQDTSAAVILQIFGDLVFCALFIIIDKSPAVGCISDSSVMQHI